MSGGGGPSHRDVPALTDRLGRVLWRVRVDGIGTVSCYGLRWATVHVTDYEGGGFDVYVPCSTSIEIADVISAVDHWNGDTRPVGKR